MSAALLPSAMLMVFLTVAFPVASFAHWDVGVTVGFAPPALPVYAQPPCPSPGYLWTPGYWAFSNEDEDYYWVPGTWVLAPSPGLLWTPGYWAVVDDDYEWREGYWGPRIGFYGGINYGFGYFGVGFAGGYWRDRDFYYNRSVTNVTNVNITNVYNSTVINNRYSDSRASYNGGDGVRARPTPIELAAAREPHRGFTALQRLQAQTARTVPGLLASVNHGRPSVAATARPGLFNGRNVEPARNASGNRNIQSARNASNSRSGEPARYGNNNRNVESTQHVSNSRTVEPTRYAGNAARNDAAARDSARQQSPTRAWTQATAPRNDRPQWNPPSAATVEHSVPARPAAPSYNYRRPESQAPAANWSRPVSYRPAPAVPAAPAYRPAPSYSPPPRAQQSVMRNQSYAMAQPRQTFAQAPRNEGNFRSAPAARASGPAQMQDRRRP